MDGKLNFVYHSRGEYSRERASLNYFVSRRGRLVSTTADRITPVERADSQESQRIAKNEFNEELYNDIALTKNYYIALTDIII